MKKVFFMLMTVSLMFVSCDSDSKTESTNELGKPVTSAVTEEFRELRQHALSDITQRKRVFYGGDKAVVFQTESKSSIVIPPHSIRTRGGQSISGEIDIVYIEIFNKSKMVVTNKPTMGLVQGNRALLETGGEFFLDITYRGEQVEIVRPITVSINNTNSDAVARGMVLWNGDINNNENLTWLPASREDLTFENSGSVYEGARGDFYNVNLNNSRNFGWCNIDKLVRFNGQPVFITVQPPAGFNDSNSSVYLAVKGEDNMLAQFDVFNNATNTFEEHAGLVPVGLECYIIFVSGQGGNFIYSIQAITVGANAAYTVPGSTLVTTTNYTDLEAAIEALP
ncbi:hypothetical protein [Flavobacterium sp. NKUCC04_CG]|uniref:hypothetical protein n=1 Tax=Flavobacterium sp. NKUCC04_CG TaxID=2842121 RepID=UPI001C5A7195|nr:hypothetical protein [Flavobacterium sp. NKUCC04_CG]MBW3519129.1 hypothetical protein [Flavobacterium sp. NKUCC04_CG]